MILPLPTGDFPLHTKYESVLLPVQPTSADLARVVPPYQAMILAQCDAIIDRTERSRYYPWIDTKLNLITGKDFPVDDPLRGASTITAWIQGRGLEALAGYGEWLRLHGGERATPSRATASRRERALVLASALMARLRQARAASQGRLGFFMTPDGVPFTFDAAWRRQPVERTATSPHSFSDLFASKGLFAAAHYLGDAQALDEARDYCRAVFEDIMTGRFVGGQPQLGRAGSPVETLGKQSHGPAMIALGMAARFADLEPGNEATEMGIRLARFVLDRHVNVDGRFAKLLPFDLVEYIDDAGRPYVDANAQIFSDPGHALEYVGLYLWFSAAVRRKGDPTAAQLHELDRLDRLMPAILARNFDNGYNAGAGGICKSVDLLSRNAIESSMPWWSLPEAIRSAVACWALDREGESGAAALRVVAACHNAFVSYYVRPELHCMAVQTRAADGTVVDSIPGTPDADPGYHTAMSLINALDIIAGI